MLSSLELLLILLGASVFAVGLLRVLQLPALLAYLLVGVVIAPYAGQAQADAHAIEGVAHFGVVFLMFSIGLEFSLDKLRAMRKHVFVLGGAQVGATMLLTVFAWAVLSGLFGVVVWEQVADWKAALVLGGVVAMSSTAMVAKLLADRGALETEHGKRVIGVLLFQDLAVIPMLVLIPALAGVSENPWPQEIGLAVLKAALLLVLLLKVGRPLIRRWFHTIARRKSHELFTLNVLLVTLLMAWLTSKFGLSMELGAFVAGMLIGETEYRYQVEDDIKPFRDLLLGLFFITLGTQLDVMVVMDHVGAIGLLIVLLLLGKFVLIALLARLTGANQGTALRTGIWLAQAGEFGFVLLTQAAGFELMPATTLQVILAAMLISLLISPIIVQNSDWLLLRVSNQEWLQRSLQLQRIASRSLARDNHVIVCGYGRCGQSVAHVLESERVPFVALDLDPDRVRAASSAGEAVVYGDSTRREALLAAGLHRASALVVTFDDAHASLKLLDLVRQLAPKLPVLVRTADESSIESLREAGAAEVVPEVVEGSLVLASHALALAGVPLTRMQARLRAIRDDKYVMLRGYFHGADDPQGLLEGDGERLQTVRLENDASAVGRAIDEMALAELGVRITALNRRGRRIIDPVGSTVLAGGDTLVLAGRLEALTDAEQRLTRVARGT